MYRLIWLLRPYFRLEKRFHKLDLDRSGAISVKEFLSVPELRDNPLVQRVVDVLDSDLSGEVDFKGKICRKTGVSPPHEFARKNL